MNHNHADHRSGEFSTGPQKEQEPEAQDALITRPISAVTPGPGSVQEPDDEAPRLEIGILTIGKPTLSMALSSLLLQDEPRIRIHIVDTAPAPIINRP